MGTRIRIRNVLKMLDAGVRNISLRICFGLGVCGEQDGGRVSFCGQFNHWPRKRQGKTITRNQQKIKLNNEKKKTVLRIRIQINQIRIHRIHMFLGLLDPDPDPLVRGMDLDPDPAPDPDLSIPKQK